MHPRPMFATRRWVRPSCRQFIASASIRDGLVVEIKLALTVYVGSDPARPWARYWLIRRESFTADAPPTAPPRRDTSQGRRAYLDAVWTLAQVSTASGKYDRGAKRKDDRADQIYDREDRCVSCWRRRISDGKQGDVEYRVCRVQRGYRDRVALHTPDSYCIEKQNSCHQQGQDSSARPRAPQTKNHDTAGRHQQPPHLVPGRQRFRQSLEHVHEHREGEKYSHHCQKSAASVSHLGSERSSESQTGSVRRCNRKGRQVCLAGFLLSCSQKAKPLVSRDRSASLVALCATRRPIR